MANVKLFSNETSARVVVCNNTSEQAYFLDWCEIKGKIVSDHMKENIQFPICYCAQGDIVGWLREMDRAIGYMSFNLFYNKIMEQVY